LNILIVDTLDNNLDLTTFEVTNYSHKSTALLNGRVLIVSFPNIYLSDSATNSAGSKGFVQYRIKPKANMLIGSQITNKAYIYFDFNDPIVTNIAATRFLDFVPT